MDALNPTLNHLFRIESGKMVSVLVKIFGPEHIHLAEDVVQEALLSALETWKFKGIPHNPKAWLYRVAKNKAIDIIRRKKHSSNFDFSAPEHLLLNSEYTLSTTMDTFWEERRISNDFLGMMFACCHPGLSEEMQITFILKILCGFSSKEIAKAFLTNEETISKRLQRTKHFFRTHNIHPRLPDNAAIQQRLHVVQRAIYLLFNEGYLSTHSDNVTRKDLIFQAIYLCKTLLANPQTQKPETYALLALICFHGARCESRVDSNGGIIPLEQQDRSQWNQELIEYGRTCLNNAAQGERISTYHIEAAIAWEHCAAPEYKTTNWSMILKLYDLMLKKQYDPVIYLNRCIVLFKIEGAQRALEALEPLRTEKQILTYYLYHALLGDIYTALNKSALAQLCYNKAILLTHSIPEKKYLQEKIRKLD